jgi:AraC-like DNA-binding protein
MNILPVRIIDIYLVITFLAVLVMLFGQSVWKENPDTGRAIFCILAGLFALQLAMIGLQYSGIISTELHLRVNYAVSLSYGPLFLSYFTKSFGQQVDWKIPLAWIIAGVILPFFKLGPGFYKLLLASAFLINLGLIFNIRMKYNSQVRPSNWHKFVFGFFATFSATYIYEMLIGPQTPAAAWQIRYMYFSELILLSGGFLFFSLRKPTDACKNIHTKVRKALNQTTTSGYDTELSLIIQTVEKDKLYRNPELTRTTLTDLTGISPNRISELINGCFCINFPEWINTYRINEARQLLQSQNKDLTIKEIYYQVGFNSKSAFYGAFKKTTGITPTAYRKSQKPLSAAMLA